MGNSKFTSSNHPDPGNCFCTDANLLLQLYGNNQTQLSDAVANVCAATTYGILYQIVSNGYYRHVVESNGTCVVTNTTFYYGFPPNTGIALPTPVLLGIAAALGGLLIAGGYLFYRKRYA